MQGGSWADGLELVGDDDRLVGFAGVLPLRLLAERSRLRAGLSSAMARRGFDPVYDRGQILVNLALMQVLGGEAISDFQGLQHLAPVIGPVASTSTVWRALSETGPLQLARVNTAVVAFQRHWWGQMAARPQGFPWLTVAGRELTGVTVVDLDVSIVFAASEKENAQPTYKGGIGFCPNLAICDNTDDMLAIDPRPGNATSNCAADNIALLDLAVSRLPGRYRRRVLVRLDGAGFSHDLLEHIAAGGNVKGRQWEFSAGWSCTDKETDAIEQLSRGAWTAGIDQNAQPHRRHVRRRPHWPARPRPMAQQDPRAAGHRARRAAAPTLPAHRHQHEGRANRLAGCPPPLSRPRGERRHTGQGTGPGPLAVAVLGDQCCLDPDRRPGSEPAGLLPAPRPPRG